MLHENPLVVDVDVDGWRNLHKRFFESAKEKKRIIVIHEDGKVLKFTHSHFDDQEVIQNIYEIKNPKRDAQAVYEANEELVDFVLILERKAVEQYFATIQSSWKANEDLDDYVKRMYSKLDNYPKGIVTYPKPANETLGLQVSDSLRQHNLTRFVKSYIPTDSTVVLAVFNDDTNTFINLVLGFDQDQKINLITSFDATLIEENWREEYDKVIEWTESNFWDCSLGLFMSKENMESLVKSDINPRVFKNLVNQKKIIADPIPKSMKQKIAWFNTLSLS